MNIAAIKNTAGAIKIACKVLESGTSFPKDNVIAAIYELADELLVMAEQSHQIVTSEEART